MTEPAHALDLVLCRRILLAMRDRSPHAPKRMPDFEDVDSKCVAEQVERLVRAGLVEAEPESGGRSVPVRLTYAGHDLLGQYAKEARWLEAQEAVRAKGWKRALSETGSAVLYLLRYFA